MTTTTLIYNGSEIQCRDERLNLTDMWKAAGADTARKPAEWLRSADARRFIDFLAESLNLGNSHDAGVGISHSGLVKVKRGGAVRGETEAHWQIGLAYAKYLSPEFHMWCNTVVRDRMEGRAANADLSELVRRTDGIARMLANKVTDMEQDVQSIGTAVLQLAEQVKAMVIAGDPRIAATNYRSPLSLLIELGAPTKRRNLMAKQVGDRMATISANWDIPVRMSKDERPKRIFSAEVCAYWMKREGKFFLASFAAKPSGQGNLKLVRGPWKRDEPQAG